MNSDHSRNFAAEAEAPAAPHAGRFANAESEIAKTTDVAGIMQPYARAPQSGGEEEAWLARQREEVFNVEVANLLADDGLPADAETIRLSAGGTRLPDVLVDVLGLQVGIEAKFDDTASAAEETSRQIRERIDENLCEVGVALLYPASIKDSGHARSALETAALRARFFSPGKQGRDWHTFSGVHELGSALRLAREELITDDVIAESAREMRAAIEAFARAVERQPARRDALFAIVTAAGATHATTIDEKSRRAAVTISGLVVLTALVLQNQLARFDSAVTPIPEAAKGVRRSEFVKSWQSILEHDYEAVFRIAAEVLNTLLDSAQLDQALEFARDVAVRIGAKGVLGRHDLIGRVYHRLLADKKFLATYYTSIGAAVMLSELALERQAWPDVDFAAEASQVNLRIGDFACGTGTLLAAAMGVFRTNHARARAEQRREIDASGVSKRLIEDLVYGYDVLAYSVQVCATAMLLGSPATQVARTRLYQVPFGGEEGYLGSLDFLDGGMAELRMFGGQRLLTITEGETQIASDTEIPRLDLAIMNPPFTRSVGGSQLLGSLTGPAFDAARNRLRRLIRRPDVHANLTAGLGTVFVELANRAISERGRIALVLPKALLTGESWEETRTVLASNFAIEWVIASHEVGQHNFSDSTSLSEVLLIGRRWRDGEDRGQATTTWVNLSENPDNAIEALATVAAVKRTPREGGPHDLRLDPSRIGTTVGEVYGRAAPRDGSPWRNAVFMRAALNDAGIALLNKAPVALPRTSSAIEVPLVALGDIAAIGRDVRDVHDAFEETSSAHGYPAFWGHDASRVTTLGQRPNRELRPRSTPAAGRSRILPAADIWKGAGSLMIAERLRLTTHRCAAVSVETRALSNTWWSVHFASGDQDRASVIALWLNSTLGLVSLLSLAEETEGAWIKIKKNKLGELPVIDTQQLDEAQMRSLVSAWDEIKRENLLPIAQAEADPVRTLLDRKLCTALGLPLEGIEALRKMFSAEPRLDPASGTRARGRDARRKEVEEAAGVLSLF